MWDGARDGGSGWGRGWSEGGCTKVVGSGGKWLRLGHETGGAGGDRFGGRMGGGKWWEVVGSGGGWSTKRGLQVGTGLVAVTDPALHAKRGDLMAAGAGTCE